MVDIDRLKDEQEQLWVKYNKLNKFIVTKEFAEISPQQQILLVQQKSAMCVYLSILDNRIALLEGQKMEMDKNIDNHCVCCDCKDCKDRDWGSATVVSKEYDRFHKYGAKYYICEECAFRNKGNLHLTQSPANGHCCTCGF